VSATALLDDLTRQGFALAREGDGLRVRPASRLTADLRRAIAANRDKLLRLLAGDGPAAEQRCPNCGGALDTKARCWKCCERLCSQCGRATGSAFIELCLSCGRPDAPRAD
jgi:hypothetical protein